MPPTLHFHPFSSFCQKVLIALYEMEIAFEPVIVDLGNAAERAALVALWPIGRFPVLRDEARGATVPESSSIIEHLSLHWPSPAPLVPRDPAQANEARHWDRIFDTYVNVPMQKIVTDRIRPEGEHDPHGVAAARRLLANIYDVLDAHLAGRDWAAAGAFGIADCAAAPALYYAALVEPFERRRHLAAYYERLLARPSFVRVLAEAAPYRHFFPKG